MKGIKVMALALTMLMSQTGLVASDLNTTPDATTQTVSYLSYVTDNFLVNGVKNGLNYTKDKVVDGYNYSANKVVDGYNYSANKVVDGYNYSTEKLGDGFVFVKENPVKSASVGVGVAALVVGSYVLYKKFLAKTEETAEDAS